MPLDRAFGIACHGGKQTSGREVRGWQRSLHHQQLCCGQEPRIRPRTGSWRGERGRVQRPRGWSSAVRLGCNSVSNRKGASRGRYTEHSLAHGTTLMRNPIDENRRTGTTLVDAEFNKLRRARTRILYPSRPPLLLLHLLAPISSIPARDSLNSFRGVSSCGLTVQLVPPK